jgi:arylsulfatase A-like enzyme
MKNTIAVSLIFLSVLVCSHQAAAFQNVDAPGQEQPASRRNIVIFIADGLRHDSISENLAPTMFHLRAQGVDFANSHSLYPTFTTPNASAFATGHLLGDTGDFGNTLYLRYPISKDGSGGTLTPFIENDVFLGRMNELYNGNYLGESTLAEVAQENGYAVAIVGKVGPAAIQDIGEIKLANSALQPSISTIIDDSTGPQGIPLSADIKKEMSESGLSSAAPDRSNGQDSASKGNNGRVAGTLAANFVQQQYFVNAATQAALPAARNAAKPFLLIYWSRDPDGSQHNQADSLDQLFPGINGPTSHAGIRNADNNLAQILDFLRLKEIDDNTDVIVVADHGFSTISKKEISRTATPTRSYAATLNYSDVKQNYLPPGFLAIDLAHALHALLFDPDAPTFTTDIGNFYPPILMCDGENSKFMHHPTFGNGIIGGTGRVPAGKENDAQIIVAANGGSDLIYLPQEAPEKANANKLLAQHIVEFLMEQDYVDGVFVRDDLGELPGTLPLSAIGLIGSTSLPTPAIIVNFKSFSQNSSLLSRVEIADSTLQEGQGMHGSFSRADTFNAMLAYGPDFKKAYVDHVPAGNADIAITVASLLKWKLPESKGKLRGRVLSEAMAGGPDIAAGKVQQRRSAPSATGLTTILQYEAYGDVTYYDQACLLKADQAQSCH